MYHSHGDNEYRHDQSKIKIRYDILAFILVSRVLLNARCRITEKHFTVQQMQFLVKLEVSLLKR